MSAAASYDPEDRRALADAVVDAKQRVRVVFALNRVHTLAAAMTSVELTPYTRRELGYLFSLPPWLVWRVTQFAPVTGRGRATRVWLSSAYVPAPRSGTLFDLLRDRSVPVGATVEIITTNTAIGIRGHTADLTIIDDVNL